MRTKNLGKLTRRRLRQAGSVAAALACVMAVSQCSWESDRPESLSTPAQDYLQRACDLPPEQLIRIWRGHDRERSEELLFVPKEPNFVGGFDLTSHSGPWDYIQEVPLVLYGPGFIEPAGPLEAGGADIVDVYPTVARLLGSRIKRRDGDVLEEAIAPHRGQAPRVVVVMVWDGGGRNVLERWPDRWPTLGRMEQEGTSYVRATVGSSPSITSSIHSSLGTGAYPQAHKVTGNEVRAEDGTLRSTFTGVSATDLRLTSFADQIDLGMDNSPKVGLLGWKGWHLGMMGHGAWIEGADKDELALIHYRGGVEITGNPRHYSTPVGLERQVDLDGYLAALDRSDGRRDGRWRGHGIDPDETGVSWVTYSNPAWAHFEAKLAVRMLQRGGYGRDRVPDLFFINFKMTDLVGHQWGLEGPEMGDVVRAQDEGLATIIEYLERTVGDFVVIVTADHGHSRTARSTGAWPIAKEEVVADINSHFGAPENESLVEASVAYGLFVDRELIEQVDVSLEDIAEFVSRQTIRDNWTGAELPAGYESRGDEAIFSAAFPSERLPDIMKCALGEDWGEQVARGFTP